MPGAAHDIGGGLNGQVWVVGTNSQGYWWDRKQNKWHTDGGHIKYLDVDSTGQPIVVQHNGNVYYRYRQGGWDIRAGIKAMDVGIGGPNDDVWYLDMNGKVNDECYNVVNSLGQVMDFGGCGNRIAVNQNGDPIVVGGDHAIYDLRNGQWDRLGGDKFWDVSVGVNGEIYGTSRSKANGPIMQWDEAARKWTHIGGAAVHISTTPDGPIVVNVNKHIYF